MSDAGVRAAELIASDAGVRAAERVVSNGDMRTAERLDAWRACGADRFDPVRFRFIDALHRRADAQSGEARRVLDRKLAGLMDAYASDLARAAGSSAGEAVGGGVEVGQGRVERADRALSESARGPFADLLAHVARHAPRLGRGGIAASDGARRDAGSSELDEMLEYFRETWSRASTNRQLRQSLDQVPRNAGPLNSSSLVHRALSLMHELSPEYLRQFLSYVDALSWLERMTGDAAPAGNEAPRAKVRKKTGGRNKQ